MNIKETWPTSLKANMTMENHFFFGIEDTSSNSCVSIVMLVYGSVHGFTGSWIVVTQRDRRFC